MMKGGGDQKSQKIDDVFYEWPHSLISLLTTFKEIVYKVVDGLQKSEIPVQRLSQHTHIREPGVD